MSAPSPFATKITARRSHAEMTLSGTEFTRRLSLHTCRPATKIRHYGILGSNHRAQDLPKHAKPWNARLGATNSVSPPIRRPHPAGHLPAAREDLICVGRLSRTDASCPSNVAPEGCACSPANRLWSATAREPMNAAHSLVLRVQSPRGFPARGSTARCYPARLPVGWFLYK
jgi:hypothetical protein